ncbi:MAG: hemerythrin domain-containing protein [Cellvibrio sp.]
MTKIAREIQLETSSQVLDAITFLSGVQRDILDLFNHYAGSHAGPSAEKYAIAKNICNLLMANMQAEEEIFHPAVKRAVKESSGVSAAVMEHSILKYLIAEIASLDVDSSVYDIKVNVLGEQVKEHFAREQIKLFPKVLASKKLDLWVLGGQLAQRMQELKLHSFSS